MAQVRVIVVSPEEAVDGNAEFWCENELMAITMFSDGRLQLRVDSRRDGEPWLIDTDSLARALQTATGRLSEY
jgi:hypothetical protein